jgi:hypothetical protein
MKPGSSIPIAVQAAECATRRAVSRVVVDDNFPVFATRDRSRCDVKNMRESPTTEHYVDPDIVAMHLGIARRTVLALTRAGKLPAYPLDPKAARKTWRYKLSEVERAFRDAATTAPSAAAGDGLGAGRNSGDNTHGSPRSRKEQSHG